MDTDVRNLQAEIIVQRIFHCIMFELERVHLGFYLNEPILDDEALEIIEAVGDDLNIPELAHIVEFLPVDSYGDTWYQPFIHRETLVRHYIKHHQGKIF